MNYRNSFWFKRMPTEQQALYDRYVAGENLTKEELSQLSRGWGVFGAINLIGGVLALIVIVGALVALLLRSVLS